MQFTLNVALQEKTNDPVFHGYTFEHNSDPREPGENELLSEGWFGDFEVTEMRIKEALDGFGFLVLWEPTSCWCQDLQ